MAQERVRQVPGGTDAVNAAMDDGLEVLEGRGVQAKIKANTGARAQRLAGGEPVDAWPMLDAAGRAADALPCAGPRVRVRRPVASARDRWPATTRHSAGWTDHAATKTEAGPVEARSDPASRTLRSECQRCIRKVSHMSGTVCLRSVRSPQAAFAAHCHSTGGPGLECGRSVAAVYRFQSGTRSASLAATCGVRRLWPRSSVALGGARNRPAPCTGPTVWWMHNTSTTLLLTCGLPGSGKTTLARRLAVERDAQRFTKDEWVCDLGADLWDEQFRVRLEGKLIELAFELLAAGRSCILDFGLWSREERDALRLRARQLGVRVELHFLDVELDELVRRAAQRYADAPETTVEMSAEQLAVWASSFQAPSNAEQRLFDAPPAAEEAGA